MAKPTLHMIAPFHGLMSLRWSHCAFSMKAYKFSKMMQPLGYHVVEYANGESESEAMTKVQMMTEEELLKLTGHQDKTAFHGNTAVIGTAWHQEFEKRLKAALRERVKKGDIICHPFGQAHASLPKEFPEQQHVETGIGYPDNPFGCHRIFESYAWMHFHQGKHLYYDAAGKICYKDNSPIVGRNGSDYEWVVPNYFDLADWPVDERTDGSGYVLFFARIDQVKGMDIVKALAEHGVKIKVAGQGKMDQWKHPNLEYLGPITGNARGPLLAGAKCHIMPSRFTEPFAGAGVESMLCGTPLIGSSFGAFTETVNHGVTGYRCHTIGDWMKAIELSGSLSRKTVADHARKTWSLEAVALRYDMVFTQIQDLYGKGWYETRSVWVR